MQDVQPEEQGSGQVDRGAKARLIRNRQASVMLEASILLQRIARNSEEGAPAEDVRTDVRMVSALLRRSAF
jgi:hypothetical protein